MRTALTYTATAAVAIVVLGVAWISLKPITVPLGADVQTLRSQVYWQERIQALGAETAYKEMIRLAQDLDADTSHRIAHAFGGALYREKGIPGYSVCDEHFFYGCSHNFIGYAIPEHGESIIGELYDACLKRTKYLDCQHSVGHGIVSYLGYDFAALKQALDLCSNVAKSRGHSLGGCSRAVFMEYNLRALLGEPLQLREVQNEDWHEPCDKLSSSFRGSCVFSLPQWWWLTKRARQRMDNQNIFMQLGTLCDELRSPLHRACYGGIGKMAVLTSFFYEPDSPASLCDISSSDAQKRLWCKSIAALYLAYAGGVSEEEASIACQGVADDSLEQCTTYASGNTELLELWIDQTSL